MNNSHSAWIIGPLLTMAASLCSCDMFRAPWTGDLSPSSPHEIENRTSAASPQPTAGSAAATTGNVVADLWFDIVRIDIPLDGARHARKVWNHVDALRIDPGASAQLARNGLRVGVASPDAWPALTAIFESTRAVQRSEQRMTHSGLPVSIVLSQINDQQSIFCYNRRNRLVGRSFDRGSKLLNIDYAFNTDLGGGTNLRISFEIRHDPGTLKLQRSGEAVMQVPDITRYLFDDLTVAMALRKDEVLIVGASDQSSNKHLVGGRFFHSCGAPVEYETVLCITPRTRWRRVAG